MSGLGMLALLSGMSQGNVEGQRYRDEQARQARMDAIQQARADREQQTFDQSQQERQGLIDAGQPVTAQPAPAYDNGGVTADDEGNPLPPQAPMATVAGKRMAADATGPAVAAANAPEAVQARQLAYMQKVDPAKALDMQAAVTRQKSQQIELASKDFDQGLTAAAKGGWDALVDYTNKSGADPAQHRAVPTKDGKSIEIHTVMPDGTLKPTGQVFSNDSEGLQEAVTMLSQGTPASAKLAHYVQAKKDKVAADNTIADNARADRLADSTIKYQDRMGLAAGERADKYGSGSKSAIERMSPDDKAEFDSLRQETQKLDEAITKARFDAAGTGQTFDPNNPNIKPLLAKQFAQRQRMKAILDQYRDDTSAPDPENIRGTGSTTTRAPTMQETVEQDMKKNGVKDATATIREGGKETVTKYGKGASMAAAAAPKDAAAPAAAPAPAQAGPKPTGDKVMNAIEAKRMDDLKPLDEAVDRAKAVLATVAKSGDPVALTRYAKELADARAKRDAAVRAGMSKEAADQYIAGRD